MNKIKFVPVALLAVCALAACGGKGGSTTSGSTTTTTGPVGPQTLKEFVAALADGEHTKEEIEGIYAENILTSSDKDVKFANYNQLNYAPKWLYAEGQEESFYEENVMNLDVSETYKKFDNDVVVTDTNYSCYDYDPEASDPEEGLADEPRTYKDKSHIYEEDDKMVYTYTRDKSAENAYSFSHSVDTSEALREMFFEGGGLSSYLAYSVSTYEELWAYYKEAWSDLTPEETFTAVKKDGALTVLNIGKLKMGLYSAERVWGYEDYEEEEPKIPSYDNPSFQGNYVDRCIKFQYGYTIDKDGFITNASCFEFAYSTTILADKNWEEGDPIPPLGEDGDIYLTEEYIAGLDLYVPETIIVNGNEIANPYTGKEFDDYLPHTILKFTTSGASLGNYEGEIPDASLYRDSDATDTGGWFDVKEMDEVE